MIHFILGGARSGKSRYAEQYAKNNGNDVVYIATADAYDDEMKRRIKQHKNQRPAHWVTIEEPLHLGQILEQNDQSNRVFLVDCLTLWLSNVLFKGVETANEARFSKEKDQLMDVLTNLQADIILVSNEVGQGITPANAMSRRFVDEAGSLHQAISALSNQVTFVTAGLPLQLKEPT